MVAGQSQSQAHAAQPRLLRATAAELAGRVRAMIAPGGRRILGVTGAPGAGKSTLCAALAQALGDQVAVVGMDGFHLANRELERLDRRGRKGAPDTFDVDGYAALLERLRGAGGGGAEGETVYAPLFDREIEEAVASAVPVFARTPLIITEGNYLLLGGAWDRVRASLDEVWFLDPPDDLRLGRLLARHEAFGKSAADARAWVERVDQRNADLILATRSRADLIVQVTG